MRHLRTKIVVIHDDISDTSPIMVMLGVKYGNDNVILHTHSQSGLDYVLNNLGQKMVVLLDKNFYEGKEKSGIKVFEEIRAKTSLVAVILTSVSNISDIGEDNLKTLINNDLFAFESFTSDYTKIIELIDNAVESMQLRVDAILEDWIVNQPSEKREKQYITTKGDKSFTLNEILESIRQRTEIGKSLEQNILKLAVDLLTRKNIKLDD